MPVSRPQVKRLPTPKYFFRAQAQCFIPVFTNYIPTPRSIPHLSSNILGLGISSLIVPRSLYGINVASGPTYFVASAAIERNRNSSAVFKMLFNAGTREHGASAPYLFSNSTSLPPGTNATMADIISNYYISFITSLDPNVQRHQDAIFWPSYSSGGGINTSLQEVGFTVLEFTDDSVVTTIDGDVGARCDFWGNQGFEVRN
jgi:hypothetical protein